MVQHPKNASEDVPNRRRKSSKAEFVRRFTAEAMRYLDSLPPAERDARIEAFGKSLLGSCGPKLSPPRIQW
jgi:hypothetical protein